MPTESLPLPNTFSVGDYLAVLRRRTWLILIVTLLATAGSFYYVRQQTRMYRASVSVYGPSVGAAAQGSTGSQIGIGSDAALVTSLDSSKCAALLLKNPTFQSDPTSAAVDVNKLCSDAALAKAEIPGGLVSKASIVAGKGNALQISFEDRSARRAQAGAQAFALSYIHLKLVRGNENLSHQREPLQAAQRKLSSDLSHVNASIVKTSAAIQALIARGADTTAKRITMSGLQSQSKRLQSQLTSISLQLLNLNPSKLTTPQLLNPTALPKSPATPQARLIELSGAAAGLVLGILVAFVWDRLDDSLRGRADLEGGLGAPLLALIPRVPGWRRKKKARLVARDAPKSEAAESYRKLRTNVLHEAARSSAQVLMVVSGSGGEGKTTTAANLAVTLAEAGKRVVLVSADLRWPRLHEFFGLENDVGLATVLGDQAALPDAIKDPGIGNLRVLSSGPAPDRPGDLLEESMRDVLASLRQATDFIVLDTASLLHAADTVVLLPMADRVLFVVERSKTMRGDLRRSREQLDQIGTPVLGAVLNNFRRRRGWNDSSPYRYWDGQPAAYGQPQWDGRGRVEGNGETRPAATEPELSSERLES